MLRSILLKLLALGIIPIALADATATSNTTVIFDRQTTTKLDEKVAPVFTCTTAKSDPDCLAAANLDDFQIHSELWLNNIADVLLSGSMFQRCRNRLDSPSYSHDKTFSGSAVELTTSRCLFG